MLARYGGLAAVAVVLIRWGHPRRRATSRPRGGRPRAALPRRRGTGRGPLGFFQHWNATPEECAASYPCDAYLSEPFLRCDRAIDIDAPVSLVFRWVCQTTVAPYSYDWIDNRGRPSPQELTAGAQELHVGQDLMVFRVVEFEPEVHLSGVSQEQAERLFGRLAITYRTTPRPDGTTRLAVRIDAAMDRTRNRLLAPALVAGDWLMMRAQLRNLQRLAERDAQR